jgi:acyl dehydratase
MTNQRLEMDSAALGLEIEDSYRLVLWRDTTNYAAAVCDSNPFYLDGTIQGGLMAPPMYGVAFTWPLLSGKRKPLSPEAGRTSPAGSRGVHATQHMIFYRPVRPGDRLKATLKVISMRQTKAGVYQVRRVHVVDEHGRPVFTEYNGTMFRGVRCTDAGGEAEDVPLNPFQDDDQDILWDTKVSVNREAPFVYDGCSGIVVPIHTSVGFAKSVELPDIILQGTCTLALAAKELVNREAAGHPEKIKELACRFSAMVVPGTDIRIQLIRREKADNGISRMGFRVLNHQGQVAVSRGYARIEE